MILVIIIFKDKNVFVCLCGKWAAKTQIGVNTQDQVKPTQHISAKILTSLSISILFSFRHYNVILCQISPIDITPYKANKSYFVVDRQWERQRSFIRIKLLRWNVVSKIRIKTVIHTVCLENSSCSCTFFPSPKIKSCYFSSPTIL